MANRKTMPAGNPNAAYWEKRLKDLQGVAYWIRRWAREGHGAIPYKFGPPGKEVTVTLNSWNKRVTTLLSQLNAAKKSGWIRFPSGSNGGYPRVHSIGRALLQRTYGHLVRKENAKALKEKRARRPVPGPAWLTAPKKRPTGKPSARVQVPPGVAAKYRADYSAEVIRLRKLGVSGHDLGKRMAAWSARYVARYQAGQKGRGLGKPGAGVKVDPMPPKLAPGKRGAAAPPGGRPGPYRMPPQGGGPVSSRSPGPDPRPRPAECQCVTSPCNCPGHKQSTGVQVGLSLVFGLLVRLVIGG